MNVKKLTVSAIFVALATICSMIKLYHFPFGGSVTLFSMLIIVLPAWIYGTSIGIICGLVYGLIQFVIGPTMISILQVILDYVLAFSVMGIAGIMRAKKNSLLKGYILAIIGRWIIATCAGLVWVSAGYSAWDGWNPIPYSIVYNAIYIFSEAVITIIIILMPPVKKALKYIKIESNK